MSLKLSAATLMCWHIKFLMTEILIIREDERHLNVAALDPGRCVARCSAEYRDASSRHPWVRATAQIHNSLRTYNS